MTGGEGVRFLAFDVGDRGCVLAQGRCSRTCRG